MRASAIPKFGTYCTLKCTLCDFFSTHLIGQKSCDLQLSQKQEGVEQ